ncbi:MAG: hypothetical protein ACQER9_00640 [Nanobdellota archaeon]
MVIDDFVLKDPLFHVGERVLDYEKIVKASDEDFARFYLELMIEYRDKDGWWSDGKIPECNECHKEIQRPEDLRRYHGLSMHPSCFRQYYTREGDDEGIMDKYWQRVANLVLDS